MTACDWCFTSFEIDARVAGEEIRDCVFLICGKETCPNTGRRHLQCFIQFASRKTFVDAKSILAITFGADVHIEPRRGTPSEAAAYCRKEGDFYEFGTIVRRARRTAYDDVIAWAENGSSEADLLRDHPYLLTQSRALEKAQVVFGRREPDRAVEVFLIWGVPFTGKSTRAKNRFPDYFEAHAPLSLRTFMGYRGEETVIVDGFLSTNWPLAELEMMIKPAVCRIPVLYGAVVSRWRRFIVTTNQHPDSMYVGAVNRDAFFSRVKAFFYVTEREDRGGEVILW